MFLKNHSPNIDFTGYEISSTSCQVHSPLHLRGNVNGATSIRTNTQTSVSRCTRQNRSSRFNIYGPLLQNKVGVLLNGKLQILKYFKIVIKIYKNKNLLSTNYIWFFQIFFPSRSMTHLSSWFSNFLPINFSVPTWPPDTSSSSLPEQPWLWCWFSSPYRWKPASWTCMKDPGAPGDAQLALIASAAAHLHRKLPLLL